MNTGIAICIHFISFHFKYAFPLHKLSFSHTFHHFELTTRKRKKRKSTRSMDSTYFVQCHRYRNLRGHPDREIIESNPDPTKTIMLDYLQWPRSYTGLVVGTRDIEATCTEYPDADPEDLDDYNLHRWACAQEIEELREVAEDYCGRTKKCDVEDMMTIHFNERRLKAIRAFNIRFIDGPVRTRRLPSLKRYYYCPDAPPIE